MPPAASADTSRTITAGLLGAVLEREFPAARLSLRDARYWLPELAPLLGDLKLQTPAALRALGVNPTWSRFLDCDKFAGFVHALVAIKYAARDNAEDAPEGAAFGEILFIRRDGVGHAINVALALDDTGEPRLVTIEPQTAELYPMTDAEKASVWEVVL